MILNDQIKESLFQHASQEQPKECCGLVVRIDGSAIYVPCKNDAPSPQLHFILNPEDHAAAEDRGEVLAVCHSHPFEQPQPSEADKAECERSGLPWIIVNYPVGLTYEFEPSGYRSPLIGRPFSHGVLDCYSLIRDYYAWELNIELPNFDRPNEWWKLSEYDLYKDNFQQAGFQEIGFKELRQHDVILMQISSQKINHGAIYCGNQVILHHLSNRMSAREVLGGWYLKCSRLFLRHSQLLS